MAKTLFRRRIRLAPLVTLLLPALATAAPPTSFAPRGIGGGGALFAPSFSPHAVDELWIGCDMSELLRSTDLGASWTPLDFRVAQGNWNARVEFTDDPLILYVVDHRPAGPIDMRRPAKSLDGGVSWTHLIADPTGGDVFHLVADRGDASRVLVGGWSELFLSLDGGASFASIYNDATGGGAHVAGALFAGADIWIATNGGLLHSGDGGSSFANFGLPGLTPGMTLMSVAGSTTGTTTRFFATAYATGDVYNGVRGTDHWGYVETYVLDWGQPAFVASSTGIAAADHPFWVGAATGDVDVAYLAGSNDSSVPTVYRTSDGGGSWQSVLTTASNGNVATGWSGAGGDRGWGYGEVAMGFAVSPADANRLAFTDFGFVHVSDDGGVSWRQAYVDPRDQNPAGSPTPQGRAYRSVDLENTSVWSLAWASPTAMFAGYSDIRGTRSTDGGVSWSFDYSGHTHNSMYRVVVHPDGTLYAATSTVHDLYQSTYLQDARIDGGDGHVIRSLDNGQTWQLVHDFDAPVAWVALDPTTPDRLFAAVANSVRGDVYATDDASSGGASTWRRLASPPRTEGHPDNVAVLLDGTLIATYSGRRDGGGAFTPSSGVFLSDDVGLTWQDRSDPGMHYWTKDVIIDRMTATESHWYAAVYSGWGGPANDLGGLYETFDRGMTWSRILDMHRVESATIDPMSPNEMYVTTEVEGLWHTPDRGASSIVWQQTAYPFRQPLRVFFNPFDPAEMWVTSFGNGLRVARLDGRALLRNSMVTQTSPTVVPALASFLPLNATRDTYQSNFASGSLDPDATILSATRPLVFYGLDGPGELLLNRVGSQIAVTW